MVKANKWRLIDRMSSGAFALQFWLVIRVVVFIIWAFLENSTQGDVRYYFTKLEAMDIVGPGLTMQEYPTPVLWFLGIPKLVSFGSAAGYVVAYAVLVLAVDGLFSWRLWTMGGRLRAHALTVWNLFIVCTGPLAYMRFDLVTAILAGLGLLALQRGRPLAAGACIGLGATLKLWPALMWPALLTGDRKHNWRATVGVFGTGAALALASLVWAGWDRLLSPLTWQSDRGLQIESVWATPAMVAKLFRPDDYHVAISRHQAAEVWGPGVEGWLAAADASFIVGIVAAIAIYALWLRQSNRRNVDAAVMMLLIVLIMIVTNKTFSPQYIHWTAGPLAGAIAIAGVEPARPGETHELRRLSMELLILTLLTQLIYPALYSGLMHDGWRTIPATLTLGIRNVGILLLTARVLTWAARTVWPNRRRSKTKNTA